MKNVFYLSMTVLQLIAAPLLPGQAISPLCAGDHVFLGPMKPLGNGGIQTFVEINGNDRPESVGVVFDGALLEALPQEPSDGNWDVLYEEVPEAAPEAGWYPTLYEIACDIASDLYTVSLEKFIWLPESQE